jgi:hypothetical protein
VQAETSASLRAACADPIQNSRRHLIPANGIRADVEESVTVKASKFNNVHWVSTGRVYVEHCKTVTALTPNFRPTAHHDAPSARKRSTCSESRTFEAYVDNLLGNRDKRKRKEAIEGLEFSRRLAKFPFCPLDVCARTFVGLPSMPQAVSPKPTSGSGQRLNVREGN